MTEPTRKLFLKLFNIEPEDEYSRSYYTKSYHVKLAKAQKIMPYLISHKTEMTQNQLEDMAELENDLISLVSGWNSTSIIMREFDVCQLIAGQQLLIRKCKLRYVLYACIFCVFDLSQSSPGIRGGLGMSVDYSDSVALF